MISIKCILWRFLLHENMKYKFWICLKMWLIFFARSISTNNNKSINMRNVCIIIPFTRCEVTHIHVTSYVNMWRHSYISNVTNVAYDVTHINDALRTYVTSLVHTWRYSSLYDVTYLTTPIYMFTQKSCVTSQTRQNSHLSSSKSIFW